MTERSSAPAGEIRFLNLIALVAIVDVLLLIPLIWASRWVAHREDLVGVLGPIHGLLFIVLIGLCAWGAHRKWWGWWFPLITVITFGPPGSLIGDFLIRRRLREETAAGPEVAAGSRAAAGPEAAAGSRVVTDPGAGAATDPRTDPRSTTEAGTDDEATPKATEPEAAEL